MLDQDLPRRLASEMFQDEPLIETDPEPDVGVVSAAIVLDEPALGEPGDREPIDRRDPEPAVDCRERVDADRSNRGGLNNELTIGEPRRDRVRRPRPWTADQTSARCFDAPSASGSVRNQEHRARSEPTTPALLNTLCPFL